MNSSEQIPLPVKRQRLSDREEAVSIAADGSRYLVGLIGRCALHDQQAFLALYDATSAKLFGVVLRLVKREHWAEEVLQDVYLKVWQAADTYHSSRGRPMTWLINIARNRAIDFLRSAEHAAAQRSEAFDDELPSGRDPLTTTATGIRIDRLAECLKGLPDGQRECILMVYHQGFTPTEVAQRTGYPLGTVKTWIRRGLEKIRHAMSNPDFPA